MAEPSEVEASQIEKSPTLPRKWDYETFKQHLISRSRGDEFLLPSNEYPDEIALSSDWHGVFNAMRNKTNNDQIERVGLVGCNQVQRAIYLPQERVVEIPWQWERNVAVAHTAIEVQKGAAMVKGIDQIVGILHSHPNRDFKAFFRTIKTGRLSAGDLWIALRGFYGGMIGVAAGEINSIAFRTKDSISPRDSEEIFSDLWEREPYARNLDLVLAEKYKMALYKGDKNGSLRRIYPKK